ncbi:MAG: hypothetical protein LBI33_01005 [Propionibacteriaceae bacterium]|nr:hypothetical protein [Propionibacteriaceae bacterium]
MDAFADAVTVIGAHAVHVWVQAAWGPVEMQATRDADIAVNPVFVAPDPKLMGLMSELGVVPALPDRPGVYGYQAEAGLSLAERVTIDLIVPEVYAGPGRRAARIDGQPSAASRARGVELAVWDRRRVLLAAMDDPADSTEAWVAGPAALLVAKAHKVHERFSQVNIRADRLRPKDSGDVALLMLVSDPAEVARVMAEHSVAHPEIAPTVSEGATWLVEMYTDPSGLLRRHAVDALAARLDESEVNDAVDHWLDGFQVERANLSQMGVT